MDFNFKLWRGSLKNINKMMVRRDFHYLNKVNEFSFLFHNNETDKQCILILLTYDKVGVDYLKNTLKLICNDQIFHYIMICEKNITSTCLKLLNEFLDFKFEIFYLKQFYYDIESLHYYVRHEKVKNNKELKRLKNIYQNKLPIILKTDPIVCYYGWSKGDYIKITRDKDDIIYRIVK